MSWRHPNPVKKKSARTSRSPVKSDLIPVDGAPKIRRPYGTPGIPVGPEGLVYAPGGPYTQPVDPGRDVRRTEFDAAHGSIADTGSGFYGVETSAALSKKAKQWKKWDEEIIPMLIEPYLRLLRETQSLRNLTALQQNSAPACDGCSGGRNLRVSCVYFESTSCLAVNEDLFLIFCRRDRILVNLHLHSRRASIVIFGSIPVCSEPPIPCSRHQYVGIRQ
jgi:hypothetical protein